MIISVLGNEGSWYVNSLLHAGEKRGHLCQRVDFRSISSSVSEQQTSFSSETQNLSNSDAIIVRTMPPGSLEQVVYRMDVLLQLQQANKFILNHPRAIECSVDKFLTTSRLAAAHLPVPRTIVCENSDQAMEAFSSLGGDVVVKPLFGAEGRGIFRLSDPDLAFRSFRTLEQLKHILYLQEFIQHEGFDVRVLVLGGKVIGAMKRKNSSDFRTNISRNGEAVLHKYTEEEELLALSSAATVHASFAGVDLLYDLGGRCHVVEVNAVPGWRAFSDVTKIDVAKNVIEYLENH